MIFKKIALNLLGAFLLFIPKIQSQVTITVPSGNIHNTGLFYAEWRKPFGTYFGFERSAFIYSHSEIGQYGTIDSIGFYCDTVNVPGNTPVNVYMKEVSNSFFAAATTVASEESGAVLVYSGTLPSAKFVKNTWINLPLANSFLHSTSNAIEIIIETNAGGTGNESNLAKGFYHYLTSFYAFQYWSADNSAPTNTGILSYKRPNIQFYMTNIPGCSGTPAAGTTVSSVDTTCLAVTLSLSGATAASGLTYQWQDSLASGAWTNISGATAIVHTGSINADTWFRCKVSCGSAFAYSVEKEVARRNYLQCYCTSNLGGGCTSSAIDSVAIETTGLMNGNTGCSSNNYTQYPASGNTCAQLASGQSYNLHTKFTGGLVNASVWLDYDRSGSLDSAEWKLICSSCKIDTDYVTVLAVPAGASSGLTLMRVRSRAAGNANTYSDACTNFGSGETEDYFIGINYDVSVQTLAVATDFSFYPNPSNGELFVSVSGKPKSETIDIYSLTGALVKSEPMPTNGFARVEIADIPGGIYLIKVGNIVKKLVVAR